MKGWSRRLATLLGMATLSVYLYAPTTADAAADLAAATPSPGAEIEQIPDLLVLRFTQELSEVQIELDGSQLDVNIDEEVARALLPELDEGSHVVSWTVTSEVDDKTTEGSYTFELVAESSDNPPPDVDSDQRRERTEQIGDDNRSEVLLWTALGIGLTVLLVFVFFYMRTSLPLSGGVEGGLPPPGQSPPEHDGDDDSHGH